MSLYRLLCHSEVSLSFRSFLWYSYVIRESKIFMIVIKVPKSRLFLIWLTRTQKLRVWSLRILFFFINERQTKFLHNAYYIVPRWPRKWITRTNQRRKWSESLRRGVKPNVWKNLLDTAVNNRWPMFPVLFYLRGNKLKTINHVLILKNNSFLKWWHIPWKEYEQTKTYLRTKKHILKQCFTMSCM